MIFYGREKAETSINAIVAGLARPTEVLRRFGQNDDGVMTYFSFFMLFMMLLVGGIGVDLMQNEMERTRLQATVDRAVLAAADLDQELDPEAVVKDYFDKAGLKEYLSAVEVDDGLNYRIVTATASTASTTRFMKFLGVDELPVPAVGTAEERVEHVEVSLVLDISGSMSRNNKMPNLRTAAATFVDEILKPENKDLISLNVIPYTAQVNVGEVIFDELATQRVHSYGGHCVDFDAVDFETIGVDLSKPYAQMQHFESGWNWSFPIGNPGCPQQDFESVMALSQTPQDIKDRINQLLPRANTSIHLGMKWGVAMLDPGFRPVTTALNLNGQADPAFAGRPAAYNPTEVLKTVVLMTDGQNVDTYRIADWAYARPDYRQHWSRYPLFWYLNNYVTGDWSSWYYTKYSSSQADSMLDTICTTAKSQGIVVWSVGFEVTDYSAGVMEDCATSPSHFFRVEGVEIEEAFEAIANQINQLRLTQ